MLNDVTWRKLPINILTDENMEYVQSQMPAGYEYAPYMFYMAMLKKVDDDGIFDLEDGEIFARLMRVPEKKMVFFVAALMAKRKMIYHLSSNSNKCLVADWEYPKGTQPRTLAERRQIVEQQIEEARHHTQIETFEPEEIEQKSFILPDDDKNQKNVVKSVFDDKNQKNVVKKNDVEREREEREIRENREKEHTHKRDRESLREEERQTEEKEVTGTSSALVKGAPDVPFTEKKTEKQKNKQKPQKEITQEANTSGAIQNQTTKAAENHSEEQEKGGDFALVVSQLHGFFSNKSFGYQVEKNKTVVDNLAKEIMSMKTSGFDASKITAVMLDVFEKMHDSDGPWKDVPLTPSYMGKDTIWANILNKTGAILAKNKKQNVFFAKAKEAEMNAESDKAESREYLANEFEAAGIDPADPHRVTKLLVASRGKSPPSAEKMQEISESVDIY